MQLEALDCVTGSFCKTSPNKALHHVGVAEGQQVREEADEEEGIDDYDAPQEDAETKPCGSVTAV